MTECRCGGRPVRFQPKGGGVGVKCSLCGRRYTHPDFDWEQIMRVWDYAVTKGGADDEG